MENLCLSGQADGGTDLRLRFCTLRFYLFSFFPLSPDCRRPECCLGASGVLAPPMQWTHQERLNEGGRPWALRAPGSHRSGRTAPPGLRCANKHLANWSTVSRRSVAALFLPPPQLTRQTVLLMVKRRKKKTLFPSYVSEICGLVIRIFFTVETMRLF